MEKLFINGVETPYEELTIERIDRNYLNIVEEAMDTTGTLDRTIGYTVTVDMRVYACKEIIRNKDSFMIEVPPHLLPHTPPQLRPGVSIGNSNS